MFVRRNRILMVAFHYPPIRGSSGVLRTLKFGNFLPELGWSPTVLTVDPRAYEAHDPGELDRIGANVEVVRAFGLDSQRHLSIRGRYLSGLSLPDRWVTWALGAVPAGLRIIREQQPRVLWTTYPIATAHLVGWFLHRLTGIPWVADFRDPMCQESYPRNPAQWRAFHRVESAALRHCRLATFTAPTALAMYRDRYPAVDGNRLRILYNGFDDEDFEGIGADPETGREGPRVVVHSGSLYPSERDPRSLFDALAALKAERGIDERKLRVVLRASGHDDIFRPMLRDRSIDRMVTFAPSLPYQEALVEMLGADGLLLLQASNCNYQIPAKVYEYARAGRPILALTDPTGDTAGVLRNVGVRSIARLDAAEEIRAMFERFLDDPEFRHRITPESSAVAVFSRRRQAAELADMLRAVTAHEHRS